MTRRMTHREFARWCDQTANRLGVEMRRAEWLNLADAGIVLHRLSTGPLTRARLEELGHPYAHGRTPPQDAAIINQQTEYENAEKEGRLPFSASWIARLPNEVAGKIQSSYENSNPVVRFLMGTKHMQERPIVDRAAEEIGPRVADRRSRAFFRSFGL